MSSIDLAILGLLLVLAASAAYVAHRLTQAERAQASIARLTEKPRALAAVMLPLFAGVIVIAQADAVRAWAHLAPDHEGYRLAIFAGYALLTLGFAGFASRVRGVRTKG